MKKKKIMKKYELLKSKYEDSKAKLDSDFSIDNKPNMLLNALPSTPCHSWSTRAYTFYDEDGRLCYYVNEDINGSSVVQTPVAVHSSGNLNFEHKNASTLETNRLLNSPEIVKNLEAELIVSPVLFYADYMQWNIRSTKRTDVVYSSWWGDVETVDALDISPLSGRRVRLVLHTGSELDDDNAYTAIAKLYLQIKDHAQVSFSHIDHVNMQEVI
ncbi:hypothetical protein LNTAR_16433 [Lentisphaera araneosa HTCC2155]|uniref:Uncharacterized protein n=1 Tax=Lentisphaera araneosa HTCC2155 TaxID=313628 RepID=A6DQA1_9BACT|nr:hypothetical protein [Lentisphaera araneosa]EDM26152.1 hypothetical protein LNTAR_16433 [Lentisphaera araneosa HTCC2155]